MTLYQGEPIGAACYACAPARATWVSGIYNPYQNDFIVVQQARPFGTPTTNTSAASPFTGWRALTTDPSQMLWRRQLDIRPAGTILYPAGQPDPDESHIARGFKYCPTRVRLEWSEPPHTHTVEISVGPGITFTLPPTGQVYVDWLIPDPAGNDAVERPDNFDPNATRFASGLICKAAIVPSPAAVRPLLTQTVFVTGLDAGGSGHQLFVPKGARSLQVFSDVAFGNIVAPGVGDTVVRFTQEYIQLPYNAPVPPPFNTFPTEALPFQDPFTTARVVVPPGYNVVRVNAGTAPGIRRNVVLVWELDI